MKIKMFIIGIGIAFSLNANSANQSIQKIFEKNLVEIHYTTLKYSSVYPWISQYESEYQQFGVFIDSDFVLTQCDELPDAITIFVKAFENHRTKAKIHLMDIEVNLCILKLEKQIINSSKIFWEDLPLGKDPHLKQKIEIGYYDEYGNFETKDFIVSEYSITSDFGLTKLPVFSFTVSKNLKTWLPIFSKNELVGFVSYISENKVIAIPISRVQFFVESFLKKNYEGFIVPGLQWEELNYDSEDPVIQYYNLKQNGCLIRSVSPHTSFYNFLKKGDIVLSIDRVKPIKNCRYKDSKLGIQKFELLLVRSPNGSYRRKNENLDIEILRGDQLLNLSIPLFTTIGDINRFERIPWKSYGRKSYLVYFGVVFVEMDRSFLVERLGKEWRRKAIELTYLYDTKKNYESPEENDRIILVSDILPDPINIGFRDVILKPITKVNQKHILNLKEMISILEHSREVKRNFIEIEISDGKKIFFDLSKEDEHRKILKKFNITEEYYIKF
ncbi:MAG: PDZ domain-containing protein [Leptonema sp. (in: bacteria)]